MCACGFVAVAALASKRERLILNAKIVRLSYSSLAKRRTVKQLSGRSDADKSDHKIGGASASEVTRSEPGSGALSHSWNAKIVLASARRGKELEDPPAKPSWNAKVVVHRILDKAASSSARRDSEGRPSVAPIEKATGQSQSSA